MDRNFKRRYQKEKLQARQLDEVDDSSLNDDLNCINELVERMKKNRANQQNSSRTHADDLSFDTSHDFMDVDEDEEEEEENVQLLSGRAEQINFDPDLDEPEIEDAGFEENSDDDQFDVSLLLSKMLFLLIA